MPSIDRNGAVDLLHYPDIISTTSPPIFNPCIPIQCPKSKTKPPRDRPKFPILIRISSANPIPPLPPAQPTTPHTTNTPPQQKNAMKPHPFPLSLNIGTDIVHLPRIARLVSRPNGYLTRFTRRILSDQEQADFRKRFNLPPGEDVPLESRLYPTHRRLHVQANTGANGNVNGSTGISAGAGASAGPTSSLSTEMARWLAGRFAAKEAARKAAPGGAASVGWKDVVVIREDEGTTGSSGSIAAELESKVGSKGRMKTSVERIREMRKERGSGRPGIVYLDANGGPGRMGKLSISHDGEYVVATVLAAG